MKKNAIFFALNDNYSFALASVLIDIKKYSRNVLNTTDIIVLHDGIKLKNIEVLKSIYKDIIFEDICISDELSALLDDEDVSRYGIYIIAKFYGFELVKKYEKVLFLDVDIIVQGDLTPIFDTDADMAWRKIMGQDSKQLIVNYFEHNDFISVPSGGVIFFNNSLNKYNIDNSNILNAYNAILTSRKIAGIDEAIIGYLGWWFKMDILELPLEYNTPVYDFAKIKDKDKVVIKHFLDYRGIKTKPWKNLAAYLYFDDWKENYDTWKLLGGDEYISFSKEDYFRLLGFDKAKEFYELKHKLNILELSCNNYKIMYEKIINSKSWRITKPLRKIMQLIKMLVGKYYV